VRIARLTEGTYPTSQSGVSLWCDELTTGLSKYDFDIHAVVAIGTNTTWTLAPNRVGITARAARQYSRADLQTARREASPDHSAANETCPIAAHRRFLLETKSA